MGERRTIWQRVKGRFCYGRGLRLVRPRWRYLLSSRLQPISELVGVDRGQPIDRYFIERFMTENAERIRGAVLEVKDRDYTVKFGGPKVTRSEVLDLNRENTAATIYGDIRDLKEIADDTFDCFILTQVLQYVDDLDAAVRESRRVIKSGGCLLVTVPTVGKLDGQEDNVEGHFWRLTEDSARYVFYRHFAADRVKVASWGNVLLGAGFLQGMCVEDMPRRAMEKFDARFTCGVMVMAEK